MTKYHFTVEKNVVYIQILSSYKTCNMYVPFIKNKNNQSIHIFWLHEFAITVKYVSPLIVLDWDFKCLYQICAGMYLPFSFIYEKVNTNGYRSTLSN